MKEVFQDVAVRLPCILQWLNRLHQVLQIGKNGLEHTAPPLLREHLSLLPYKDKIFNDFLFGLEQQIASQYALRQVLEGLRHRCLTALLQPGHCIDEISHRCANGTVTQLAANGAPAYHCGAKPRERSWREGDRNTDLLCVLMRIMAKSR